MACDLTSVLVEKTVDCQRSIPNADPTSASEQNMFAKATTILFATPLLEHHVSWNNVLTFWVEQVEGLKRDLSPPPPMVQDLESNVIQVRQLLCDLKSRVEEDSGSGHWAEDGVLMALGRLHHLAQDYDFLELQCFEHEALRTFQSRLTVTIPPDLLRPYFYALMAPSPHQREHPTRSEKLQAARTTKTEGMSETATRPNPFTNSSAKLQVRKAGKSRVHGEQSQRSKPCTPQVARTKATPITKPKLPNDKVQSQGFHLQQKPATTQQESIHSMKCRSGYLRRKFPQAWQNINNARLKRMEKPRKPFKPTGSTSDSGTGGANSKPTKIEQKPQRHENQHDLHNTKDLQTCSKDQSITRPKKVCGATYTVLRADAHQAKSNVSNGTPKKLPVTKSSTRPKEECGRTPGCTDIKPDGNKGSCTLEHRCHDQTTNLWRAGNQPANPKIKTKTSSSSKAAQGIWDILNNLKQQDPYDTPLWGGENELEKWLKIRLTKEQQSWALDVPNLPLINTTMVMELPDDGTQSLKEVKDALRHITDDDYFESKLKEPIRNKPKTRVSKEIQNQVESLVTADYMNQESDPQGRIGLFARAKPKKKLLRTIVDARPVNSAMENTPPVQLPGRDDVRRMVKKHAFVCELDGKGFFHQFPLTRKIRRWFCAMIGGKWYSWTRLPMGWAYSVYIAQAFSRWLTDNLGPNVEVLVYIDNVYIFGASVEEVEHAKSVFLRRCEEVSATFETSTPTGSTCQILGMTCDLAKKEISMPSTLQQKLNEIHTHIEQLHTEKRLTYRLLWILLGNAVWGGRILGEPMCHYPNLLQWISEESAKLTTGQKKWGDRAHLWPKARSQLATLIQKLAENTPWRPAGDSVNFSVYTDASDIGYGIICSWDRETAYAGRWNADMQTKIIAERELHASVAGVKRAINKILHDEDQVLTHQPHTKTGSPESTVLERVTGVPLGQTQTPGSSEVAVGRTPTSVFGATNTPSHQLSNAKITLFTDNMNVQSWIQKGRAKTYFANKLLAELFHHLPSHVGLEVVWVQSADNPADFPSRHPELFPRA